METCVIDFVPWGLAADWPTLRWMEPIPGRRGRPAKGVRLGHADTSAMVLVCTLPRDRFDAEIGPSCGDPVGEVAFETAYAQVNLVLHQLRTPGERPGGLIESLVSHAGQRASQYRDWPKTRWGEESASTTQLASWQSAFSLDYPDAYVIVHACGVGIGELRLQQAGELSGYDRDRDPLAIGAMHWELWPSHPELAYDDLVKTLATS